MAEKKKEQKAKETDAGTLGRLSKAGEDAITRFIDELGKNERVTDAVARAMAAKGKLDEGAKRAVGGVGLAAAEELKDLRKHIERLEQRLAKLEGEAKPASKPRATKPKTTTTRAKKTTDQASSPAPGRSVGGGTSRGAGSGGTTAA
jgi:polyhydroxyalkanoate synthesis regulator phasin